MTAHNTELDKERLLQLSCEVGRIATTLARLSSEPELLNEPGSRENGPVPEIAAEQVALAIRARRLRTTYFEQDLFADPAWDMLIELLHAELTHRRVLVTRLCDASGVAPTTALRWIKTMVAKGLLARRDDPFDGRRVYVELQPSASNALKRYFSKVLGTSAI